MGSIFGDILIVGATQLAFFVAGWAFFMRKISSEYKVKNRIVLGLFAATFSLSCTLFELIIFEILDILNRSVRWLLWKLSIVGMLSMLIVILPVYQIRMLVVGRNRGATSILTSNWVRLAKEECLNYHRKLLNWLFMGILEGWRSIPYPK